MSEKSLKSLNWGAIRRSTMITTGLILLTYTTMHLLNLSLGLHSAVMMDALKPYLTGIWTGPTGGMILLVTVVAHMLLALYSIYRRETFRMPMYDLLQIMSAVLIVPLLAPHAITMAVAGKVLGNISYAQTLESYWIHDPFAGLRQVAVLVVVWIHGVIGLLTWLKAKTWAWRYLPWIYPIAVAIPIVALLGYVEGGRQIIVERQVATTEKATSSYGSSTYGTSSNAETGYSDSQSSTGYSAGGYGNSSSGAYGSGTYGNNSNTEQSSSESYQYGEAESQPESGLVNASNMQEFTHQTITGVLSVYWSVLGLVLLARFIRIQMSARDLVELVYLTGDSFKVKSGPSLLDISRMNDLPHANICRGRGRCGTCQVRIIAADPPLPAASQLEQATLDRLNSDPDIRLACQVSPSAGRLELERLVPADFSIARTRKEPLFDDDEGIAPEATS